MKTLNEVLRRPWAQLHFHRRYIDKDGTDRYCNFIPVKGKYGWEEPEAEIYDSSLESHAETIEDRDWAWDNWAKTLQHYVDYIKLSNQQP